MTDHFVTDEPGTILNSADGYAITPQLPSGLRVVLIVSEEDREKVLHRPDRVTVTDLVTGFQHRLRRADCGAGCRCAVEFE